MKLSTLRHLLAASLIGALSLTPLSSSADDIKLPELSDSTSGIVSPEKEYVLGRTWLKAFRSQTKEYFDPVVQQYVENLINRIARYSELNDKRLEITMVDNPTMNAFAVPGGVVGVHTGLFSHAENEHQIASVFAHELAHLSQRHFARRMAEQKKSTITTMAGLLAGLVLAATADGDAGIAAMTASQALAMDQQLRYSRQNEQEADRIGIETLYKAGMDPAAAPAMFERMLRAGRFSGSRLPEFLRTHPLTEKRVADARNRLEKYPAKSYSDNVDYHLNKARIRLHMDKNPQKSIIFFRSELDGHTASKEAARYGLMLALIQAGQFSEAEKELALLKKQSNHLYYSLAEIDLQRAKGNYELAEQINHQKLLFHPNDYPLQMALAETYLKAKRYGDSDKILTAVSRQRPTDPYVWYELAEVRGLAGNIAGVHTARAEYFILVGAFGMARDHLDQALKLTQHDFKQTSIIRQRMIELAELEEQIEKL